MDKQKGTFGRQKFLFVGAEGGIFAYGEDTLILRLTSELVDLRMGYANPRTLRCSVRDRPTVKINKRSEKTDRLFIGAEGGVFAYGEDTLILRLTSELVDLRMGYANPRTLRCSVRDRP